MPVIDNQQEHNLILVTEMSRLVKLGVISVVLLVSASVPPFLNWREPIAFGWGESQPANHHAAAARAALWADRK
jgi:hypothetical protein